MKVMNDKNWKEICSIDFLSDIHTDPLGPRHQPINHGFALERFKEHLNQNEINISSESGLLSQDNYRYLYVADVNSGNDHSDYTFTLGFINYNDRSRSFTGINGEKVFICSNQCFSGIGEDKGKRHTSNVYQYIEVKIDNIMETFKKFKETRYNQIEDLKQLEFTDRNVSKILFDLMGEHQLLSNSDIKRIKTEWIKPRHQVFEDRSAWSFHNSFTEILKRCNNPIRKVDISDHFKTIFNKEIEYIKAS